ncbi:MAG: GYF domain-containing protein [Deltaproteobacteria bacterium]|nr:GYF domain-containing protein [Deltaproteobacteria bacterium]
MSTALEDLASASEDWHVGINGVPMGPMRLSELRSKAGSGAVTAESLVWRDGFEEWLPLKNFPELLAIVEEGLSSARASRLPPEPLASAAPPAAVAAVGAPVAAVGALSDPFKPSRAAVVSEQAAGDFDLDAVIPPRRGTSPAAWIAVAVALLFGLTIGFVVFNKDKPAEQIVKYVEVPASGSKGTPGEPGAASTAAATGDDKDAGAPAAGAGGKLVAKGAPAAKSGEPPSSKPTGLSGLDGLSGLQGPGGPKAPSGDGSGAGSSGEPLDGAKVQATVSRYTSSVRRSCWQPALDARDKDAPTSARVSVTIKVAPSGSVQSVSTSGDPKGYHGLAGCIGSKVRGWQFPPSSGSTTVNVPFVFAAQ